MTNVHFIYIVLCWKRCKVFVWNPKWSSRVPLDARGDEEAKSKKYVQYKEVVRGGTDSKLTCLTYSLV